MTRELAILGMAGRFAGADDTDALWDALAGGQGGLQTLDPVALRDLDRQATPPPGDGGLCTVGLISDASAFDPRPFGLTAVEAKRLGIRPQLLLQAIWHAFEDAGLNPERLRRSPVSVYVGAMRGTDENDAGYRLANRVSHILGFTGASQTVDAAHASAMAALHQARAALIAGETEFAVVAAIAYDFAFWQGAPPGVVSPTGRCRVFAADADGVVPSEGVGALLLARKDIAKTIGCRPRAWLLGTAVGHAGDRSTFGQPSFESQAETLRAALAAAGVPASAVGYVEAHGTGTIAGDPVEMGALRSVLADSGDRPPPLVGSAKAVIGHAEAAAGMAGLIKTIMVLERRRAPGQPELGTLNPLLGVGDGSLGIPVAETKLPRGGAIRAVTAALGFGGVAAYAVLAPASVPRRHKTASTAQPLPFVLSAATDATLVRLQAHWRDWLARTPAGDRPPLAEVSATLCLGRAAMAIRTGGLAADWAGVEDLLGSSRVATPDAGSPVGLLFDGGANIAADVRLARVLVRAEAVSGAVTAVGGGIDALLTFADMNPDEAGVPRDRPAVAVVDPVTGRPLGPRSFAGLVAEAQAHPQTGNAIRARWQDLQTDLDTGRALAAWTSALAEAGNDDGLLGDITRLDALKRHLDRWHLPVGGGADDGPEATLLAAVAAGLPRRTLARALAGNADAVEEAEAAVAGLVLPRSPDDGPDWAGDGEAWRAAANRAEGAPAGRWIALSTVREKGLAAFLLERWLAGAAVDLTAVFEGIEGRAHGLPLYPFEAGNAESTETRPTDPQPTAADEDPIRRYVKRVIADVIGLPVADISDDAGLAESCGVDSYANQEIVTRLEKDLGPLPPTLLFSHGTVASLAGYLADAAADALARVAGSEPAATAPRDEISPRRVAAAPKRREPVAVVGLGGMFPGAADKDAFWRMLLGGVEQISEVPTDRWNWRIWRGERGSGDGRTYTRWGGFVDGADQFDPLFFNLSPAQAGLMDPQQRLFMEAAWNAVEDAGHTRASLAANTGVFVGASTQTYALLAAQMSRDGAAVPVETDLSDIANRVSYFMDLHGPSLTVDTACSASLTAVHLALRSLYEGETAAALVGGVNLTLHPNRIAQFCAKGMLSPESHCWPFGEGADGFVDGEGACALLLKPLSAARADGDHVYGLLRGSAVNSGGRTSGYTVPNPEAQAALVRAALADAGVSAATIGYVECHGTGTRLGDPIEIEGLTQAFRADTQQTGFCAIGSLKANIGHLIGAAGIAGLTKTLLQLEHRMLAPSLNADPPNSRIDFAATPFVVNRTARPWPGMKVERSGTTVAVPRRAGVSSFGSGGSNAHVVVEEAPVAASAVHPDRERPQVVPLSARTPDELAARAGQLLEWLDTHDADLADVAHTLRIGREAMKHRLAVIVSSMADLREALADWRADERPHDGTAPALSSAAKTWRNGGDVDWNDLYDPRGFRRVSLPAYPFARMRCWLPEPDRDEMRVVAAESVPDPLRGMVHVPAWSPAPLQAPDSEPAPKRVLVIRGNDDGGLAEAIARRHAGAEILYADDGRAVDRIYFLAGAVADQPADVCDPATQEAETDRGVLALFRLVKTAMERGGPPPRLTVVTSAVHSIGADDARNPWHAALHGYCKSLAKEHTGWRVSCLDVDLADSIAEPGGIDRLAAAVVAEAADPRGDETVLRGDVRHRRILRPVDLPQGTAMPYRDRGIYLIVGGAGGIGAAFSRFLAERHRARLVWVGRRPLDAAIRATMAEVDAAGGKALYVSGDAADVAVIRKAVALAREKFGGLNGAIHSAVVLRDRSLVRMSEEDFMVGLTAKTAVASALLTALRDEDIDFLVFFSSVLSMVGLPGQANYTAGCAVKDALAHTLDGHWRWPVLSLNWGYWRDVGVVADAAYEKGLAAVGLLSMPTTDALSAIGRILAAGLTQAIPMKATDALLDTLGRQPSPQSPPATKDRPAAVPAAATVPPAQRLDGLAAILEAVGEALGLPVESIDPDASFRDYGVDSITGVAVIRTLNRRLGTNLPVTVVFDHPSARALAAAVGGIVEPKAVPAVATPRPPDVPAGSTDDTEVIRDALAEALSIPVDAVAPDSDVQDLGLDLIAAHAAARRLSIRFGQSIDPSLLFERRTPSAITAALSEAPAGTPAARRSPSAPRTETANAVAVIGMAGRFPGAGNLDAFWDALAGGRDCVTDVPPERWDGEAWYDPNPDRLDRTHCKWGGFVSDVDLFDPAFFGLSFREACLMDPQQRLFLETCWLALSDGGYGRETAEGMNCGVFAGVGEADYLTLMEESGILRPGPTFWGNSISALPARISYQLDLRGPALAIDTACSSSLVAVHEACQSVANGECDVALAGGAHIRLSHRFHVATSNAGMLSTTGRCAAFDDSADGFVPGEGIGAVLLKRLDAALADGDRIHGVIRGSAINQDGRTNGLTAPSVHAQTDVELAAWRAGNVDPETISYIEAHGTGTPLGDPIEVAGLTAAFRTHTERRQFCAIGSVKTNIGHASMAAGVAGLLKVLLMMRHRKIPPSLHFRTPNPHIDFAASPFRVATTLADWRPQAGPLRAAVSSFGMSGTNAHVVLEEAPEGTSHRRPPVDMPAMNRRRCWFDLIADGTFSMPVSGPGDDATEGMVRHAQVRAEIADILGMPPVALDDDGDLAAQGLSPARANALRRRLAARFAVHLPADGGAAKLGDWIAAVENATAASTDDGDTAVQAAVQRLRDGLVRTDTLNRERNKTKSGRSGAGSRVLGGAE